MLILVTGATGKVGQAFLERLLGSDTYGHARVRALCHKRVVEESRRVEVVRGSIADREVCRSAMQGVTHVLHLATCKETPEDVMDVAVKGMFWLLEEARASQTLERFLLVGGDAAVGHCFYPHPLPVTEAQPHSAYPGCYALSKVLEEVMLEQYRIQYGLDVCCLRAPWIMEKDDFRFSLSFGDDVFGGPRWSELVSAADAARYAQDGTVPLMVDVHGQPIQRNFVHVCDLIDAVLIALEHPQASGETLNVCMDEPVDYGAVAAHLERTRGLAAVRIEAPFASTWLDNAKAKFLLGWRPQYDLARLIDEAYDYVRPAHDPRKVWYPG
ncbi:MAG: NAD(P)-dependent oxidoreductase [Planctomycetota bacterium]|nr:NAD(P)-dependent oxidoreductase [Planctomycetota bacterium]